MPRLCNSSIVRLADVLSRLYDKYNRFELIKPDPLQFVYKYSNGRDMEIAGFLAAVLAYGRVAQIEKSVGTLLDKMGKSPFDFVVNFGTKNRKEFGNFRHRFTSGQDICDLLELLKFALTEYASIEKYFISGYSKNDETIIPPLSVFCKRMLDKYKKNKRKDASRGLRYLLCDPAQGSACKRLNLFLRWMVRDDDVDAGIWKSVDKAKLIVPVDVHMARLCRFLGLYESRTVSLPAAIEITKAFAQIEPSDPVKYDFALSRIGITEQCTGKYRRQCDDCELVDFCRKNL
ncbi:MAG: TIGR02757 family protein [Phycisphaerae bacterium]